MSVAVYVTGVMPRGNSEPGACELTSVATVQLSDAVGAVQDTAVSQALEGSETLIFEGQLAIVGGMISMLAVRQQTGFPLMLVRFITLKFPKTSPTETAAAHVVSMTTVVSGVDEIII
jgi:hypothetical protein